MKKTFKQRFMLSLRKLAISLKRNYYIIPLIFVVVCCVHFMCNLYITSSAFSRIPSEKFSAIVAFIIELIQILTCVVYLNYALTKYGQKRPIFMLILYFVFFAITFSLTVMLTMNNYENLQGEIESIGGGVSDSLKDGFIQSERRTHAIMVTQIVLQSLTFILVVTAPLIQKQLKKLTFKRVSAEDETQSS